MNKTCWHILGLDYCVLSDRHNMHVGAPETSTTTMTHILLGQPSWLGLKKEVCERQRERGT